MKNIFLLFALLALNPFRGPWLPASSRADKCETYEDDCGRGGSDDDEPTRPADPDNPDDPGDER